MESSRLHHAACQPRRLVEDVEGNAVEEFVQEDTPFYGQSGNAVVQQRESPLMEESSADDDIENYTAGFEQTDQEENDNIKSLFHHAFTLSQPLHACVAKEVMSLLK